MLKQRGRSIEMMIDEQRIRRHDRPVLVADASRIRAAFGWHPATTLRDGLAQLLKEVEAMPA